MSIVLMGEGSRESMMYFYLHWFLYRVAFKFVTGHRLQVTDDSLCSCRIVAVDVQMFQARKALETSAKEFLVESTHLISYLESLFCSAKLPLAFTVDPGNRTALHTIIESAI